MTPITASSTSAYTELQTLVLTEMCKKLLELKDRFSWPQSVSEAAFNYAEALTVQKNDPNAIDATWTELLRQGGVAYGSRNGTFTAKAVRRRFAAVCFELGGHLKGATLPGFTQKWFAAYFKDVARRREAAEQEVPVVVAEAATPLDKRIRRCLN